MRAVVITEYGDVDVLKIQEVPDPDPGPDQVLVEITSSAMNRADLMQRQGQYPAPGPKPAYEVPGLEYSGRIAAVGSQVMDWAVGDAVMGIVAGGAMAELVVTHERMLQPVPSNLDVADAAAIPEVFMTAHDALVTQGMLGSGARALVHAGASGVGTASIQIVKALGGEIAVTCSAGKASACRDLGADVVIDYAEHDFVDVITEWTDGSGVDVVLDVIGGEYLAKNLRCVKVQGRIVQVGAMGGPVASLPLGALLPLSLIHI